jgi:hypothetical protein
MDPGMGIHPLHLYDLAFEQDWTSSVEFSAKGVMSGSRRNSSEQRRGSA